MSGIDDLNNNTSKAATEIMYPDGEGGPVQAGLPAQPTSRPSGYASSTEGTGIPNGVESTDLPEGSRRTLNDWLNQQTSYNITQTPESSNLGDGTIDSNSFNHKFVDPSEISTVYSQDPDARLNDTPLNTQQLPYGKGGKANTLLRDVVGNGESDGAYLNPGAANTATDVGRTSEVLSRNRFEPGESFTNLGPARRQSGSGLENWSDPQKFKRKGDDAIVANTFGRYNEDLDGLSMAELQRVAEQLLFNAVGDKKTSFGDKNGATFNAGAGNPLPAGNAAQLGRGRTNFNADIDFRPANAIRASISENRSNTTNVNGGMADFDLPYEDLEENEGHIRTSYGVLNNPLEPFRPGLPISMIFLAAVGALASLIVALVIAAVLDVLGVLVSLAGGTLPPENGLVPDPSYQLDMVSPDPAKLSKGRAFGNDDYGNTDFFSALSRWLNIPALEATYPIPWLTCLTATTFGALEFFIGNSFSRVAVPQIATNSAGYYVVVIRNAMRDMEQITEAFDGLGGGGAGAIEGFFALIDAFTSSATFKFVTTLMQIGDRMLCGPGLGALTNRDSDGRVIDKVLPENKPGPVVIKELGQMIRRKSDESRLAYSFTSLPQVYLRPRESFSGHTMPMTINSDPSPRDNLAELRPTDTLFGQSINVSVDGASEPLYNRLTYFNGGRIDTRFREKMEGLLNSYYVPFYFHDMRTNEIMPLPTFVEGISDSFSPSWTEQKGFGRADPVQIYGGTTRKIGFSFYMVATNQKDYSALYYGINKLVSMVYPQWGAGGRITNAKGQSFKKPYSMVQTASPLVRIRLGELFASNRTTETVRRLFGANEPGFAIGNNDNDEPIIPSQVEPEMSAADIAAVLARAEDEKQPSTYDLVTATVIASGGGEVNPLLNFAGCDNEGNGGALTLDGTSFLLPPGTIVQCPAGKYKQAEYEGTGFRGKLMQKFKIEGFNPVFKIKNYGIKGGKKVKSTKKGGGLKSEVFYVCEEIGGFVSPEGASEDMSHLLEAAILTEDFLGGESAPKINEDKYAGVVVPIKAPIAAYPVNSGTGLPELPPPIGPEPPPEPVLDHAFFRSNLVVDAMRESGGNGLAGAITSLDFDWNMAPWETDPSLGRAPTYVKVSITFNPIHDEPLGLNPDGSLRAAAYPVGDLVEKVFGKRFSLPPAPDYMARLAEEATASQPPPPPPPPTEPAPEGLD